MQVRRRIAIHLAVVFSTALLLLVPLSTTASATTFGPDGFGYTADDAAPGAFEDISGTGAAILTSIDDATVSASIGFTFPFYGGAFTDLFVSSNGSIMFGTGNDSFVNTDMTTAPLPQPWIAPMWNDWVTSCGASDQVFVETLGTPGVDQRFIAQWQLVSSFGGGCSADTITFQAALFEDGDIEFRYLDVFNGTDDAGATSTVGITAGTSGGAPGNGFVLQTSFDSASLSNGQVIRFTRHPGHTLNVQVAGFGSVVGPGIDCPGDCTELFFFGSTVTLDAISPFPALWGGDCSGSTTTCSVVMTQGRSVNVLFVSGGGGGDDGGGGGGRAGVNISLSSNQDGTNNRPTLAPGDSLVLKGRVRSGRAVCTAGVEVELRRHGGRLLTTVISADDGRFRFGPFVIGDLASFLDVEARVDRTSRCKPARSSVVTVPKFRVS